MPPISDTFSLSTSWNYKNHKSAKTLIDEIKLLGFDSIELNFALSESFVKDVAMMVSDKYIRVSSTHNFCPIPEGTRLEDASPDYFSLASSDEKERRLGVFFTERTIEYAQGLGAKAVILHVGKIKMKDTTRRMADALGDKILFEKIKRESMLEMEREKKPFVENAVKSLKELVPFAKAKGVKLAVENRFYYTEIPGFEELEYIFSNFGDTDLFYWHDVGHAQVYEILGFLRHEAYLEAFSNRLLGVHIHDIIPPISDHRPPGKGVFDFKRLRPYLTASTIKVLEVHEPASGQDILESVKLLKKILYD